MRKLTQDEIDSAPDWATDYAVIKGQVIMIGGGQITKPEGQKVLWSEVLETDFKTIPRKEVDISEYEFSDCELTVSEVFKGCKVEFHVGTPHFELTENDSIALAKHFGHYKDLL